MSGWLPPIHPKGMVQKDGKTLKHVLRHGRPDRIWQGTRGPKTALSAWEATALVRRRGI
ncbi:hypothetical protein Save01_04021 [Streptomyces avermitilis]|uniref:Uncharacterized protein n=1 Tax=Streptomyces avermitilis TaxID=33903 RepID=A0A4D4MCH4_STRAX|nr:hypothetical protein SAVMC3_06370 [Streptomyces avermitilis]GDY69628.1 hypothetical protein SAV14893_090210 [Streptomyces avermitilis]GDY79884.1 hypothetical protein SAV31267_093690 [Streptomyces avermitilis]